jgi:predicted metal-dependent peptidase
MNPNVDPRAEIALLGIVLRENHKQTPTACAVLTSHGYEIWTAPGWAIAPILWHEVSHILRGDCITMREVPPEDRRIANIAMDALINRHIDMDEIRRTFPDSPGIKLEELRQEYPEIPLLIGDWEEVAEVLKKHADTVPQRATGDPQMDDDVTLDEAKKQQAIITARAYQRGLLRMSLPMAPLGEPHPTLRNINRIVRAVTLRQRANDGLRQRVRSWTRPGRVRGLRGHATRHVRRVAILYDCSGSMTEWIPVLMGTQRALAKSHELHTIVYDTRVRWQGTHIAPRDVPYGGGTTVSPALAAAAAVQPDVVVAITDGEHEGSPTIPANLRPIIWCIVPHGTKQNLALRPQDRVLEIAGEKNS